MKKTIILTAILVANLPVSGTAFAKPAHPIITFIEKPFHPISKTIILKKAEKTPEGQELPDKEAPVYPSGPIYPSSVPPQN